MYRDNTLIPAEAVRLAALGSLVDGDKSYGDLAREIRFFVARIVGPSLDLLGTSLELLRLESGKFLYEYPARFRRTVEVIRRK